MWAREAVKCGDGVKKYWGKMLVWDEGWGCGSAVVKINNGKYEISWEKEGMENSGNVQVRTICDK